jgi:hypothetical protein
MAPIRDANFCDANLVQGVRRAITFPCGRRAPRRGHLIAGAITLVSIIASPLFTPCMGSAAAQTPGAATSGTPSHETAASAPAGLPLPLCLQAPVDALRVEGVAAMVVIADRSRAGAVDSAGTLWREHHPDLLVWSGPSGVHVMARWLSYAESRRLAQPYVGHTEVCALAELLRAAGERRMRTVWTLVLVGTTALLLMLVAVRRAPRRVAQNSK